MEWGNQLKNKLVQYWKGFSLLVRFLIGVLIICSILIFVQIVVIALGNI